MPGRVAKAGPRHRKGLRRRPRGPIRSPLNTPTEQDWGDYKDGLDAEWAHKNFYGKSLEQALELFAENALYYQEDLGYMAAVPFRFYLSAFIRYLLSEQSKGDSDGAATYLELIIRKLDEEPKTVEPLIDDVLACAERVASSQAFYDADVAIYGVFAQQYQRITELCNMRMVTVQSPGPF